MWTFNGGNPSTSTMRNPTVTYNTEGRFDVSYTVSNPQGSDTETKAGYITVVPYQPPPVADFTASSVSITDGKQVTFTDKSTNAPTSWSWSFPGGTPSHSNQQNPTVTYNTMGIYDVILRVSNPGGDSRKTKNDYIQVSKFSNRGIFSFDFSSPYDRALVFDYNNDRIDDLFLYRPGSGVACVIRSNGDGTFDNVYYADGNSSKGIGLYDLMSITDQALKFDYDGDGNDDLFLYRPGRGAAGVVRSNGDGTFTSVYNVIDNGSDPPNGIGGYTLLSSKDRVLAFHLNNDINEDLLLYRPSRGAISVLTSRGDGTFRSFYSVIDNGATPPNGICWFDLLASNDKALAFNYNGGTVEELLFYRAGRGAVSVVSPNSDGTFRSVYSVIDNGSAYPNGIGGYNLLSTKDIVLAFDYDGDSIKDLLLFRPGRGAISVVHSNWDETFSSVYQVIDNGAELPNGICEFDLLSTNDQALIFDYNGDGYEDIFFYRPGSGAVNIVCSNGDATFYSAYSVIDNGSTPPNGIGGYNLLSVNDCALAYDYDGSGSQGLFLYRPGGRLVGIIPGKK
jgi:PKD repeat protein